MLFDNENKRTEIYDLQDLRSIETPFVNIDKPKFPIVPISLAASFIVYQIILGTALRLIPMEKTAVLITLGFGLLIPPVLIAYHLYLWVYVWDTFRYTNEFVEYESGIISRETRCILWSQVESVSSKKNLFQRIFSSGDIRLHLSPKVGSIERSAELLLSSAGSIGHKSIRGETIVFRDVYKHEEKVKVIRKLIAASQPPSKTE